MLVGGGYAQGPLGGRQGLGPSTFFLRPALMLSVLKSWCLNGLLVVVPLVVLGLAAELGVRGLQKLEVIAVLDSTAVDLAAPAIKKNNARIVRSDNEKLVVDLDPNDPAVNSFGMRDREYQQPAAAGVRRIAVMGDSVTFGLGVPQEATYVRRLEGMLNRNASSGESFQLLNFGINGLSTAAELELYKIRASQFRPELVIIGYVLNDPAPPLAMLEAVSDGMRQAHEFGELAKKSQVAGWIKLTWDRATTAIRAANAYHPYYDPQGEYWQSVADSLAGFKALSEREGFDLVVAVFPMLHQFDDYPFDAYHQQVLRKLEELQITYVDLLPAYANYNGLELRIVEQDATHPNELGHRVAAEALYPMLSELLEGAPH